METPNWNIEAFTSHTLFPVSHLPQLGFLLIRYRSLSSPFSLTLGRNLREKESRGRRSLPAMTGKAKPKKHTAKEIFTKIDAATTNRGGGKAGLADRSGVEKGGHAKFECPLCKATAPDVKSMQIHHDARHPRIPFDESKLNNLHTSCTVDPTKPRPGVRGSFKK